MTSGQTKVYKIRLVEDKACCSVDFGSLKIPSSNASIKHDSTGICTLQGKNGNAFFEHAGKREDSRTTFLLFPSSDGQYLDLLPLKETYIFGQDKQAQPSNRRPAASPKDHGSPNPDNPFDYRHYLKDVTRNLTQSPAPSAATTPLLVPVQRCRTPLMIQSDTEDLPSMAVSRKDRKEAALKARPVASRAARPRPQGIRRPAAAVSSASSPAPHLSPAPQSSPPPSHKHDRDTFVIEYDSQPNSKRRRRLDLTPKTSESKPRSLNQAASTPVDAGKPHSFISGKDPDDGYAERAPDDDIEDELELLAPANKPPERSERHDSKIDDEGLDEFLAAFQEDSKVDTIDAQHIQAALLESVSESEEE